MEEQTIGNDPFDSGILRRGDIRRFDGTGNHTDPILRTIGGVGTRYRRTTPIAFADGLQAPAGSRRNIREKAKNIEKVGFPGSICAHKKSAILEYNIKTAEVAPVGCLYTMKS